MKRKYILTAVNWYGNSKLHLEMPKINFILQNQYPLLCSWDSKHHFSNKYGITFFQFFLMSLEIARQINHCNSFLITIMTEQSNSFFA